jgi:site-specific DNA recombinase
MIERERWAYVGTHNDGGRHGDRSDHRDLGRLLADWAAGQIDVVVVKALDRLGRDVGEIADTLALFDASRVRVVVSGRELDRVTPEGHLHTDIEAIFSAYERRKIRKRTKDALAARAHQGLSNGGPPSDGWMDVPVGTKKDGSPIHDASRTPSVRR